jgi:hypothetical protein
VSTKLVLETENHLLREQVNTALGARNLYRVADLLTGDIIDFDTAQKVMDYLFVVGGMNANRKFAVYKERRRFPLPAGGEVNELARQLEAW